ncbi:class I SAM-dependent methyltransferase [Leptolyngbya ectocarpi]|nr:class I SAM-dependent methyltransferase [Leptolyngbya ectocarpi]
MSLSSQKKEKTYNIAYEPDLVPPLNLMDSEGIDTIEEWFRWAEEWSMLLRIYGKLNANTSVLEIGCGLGRIAFPLRYLLIGTGSYDGFDISKYKIDFLKEKFSTAHPRFRFAWADILNTYYNPDGKTKSTEFRFPYPSASFELVYAASVFTHLLPENTQHYFKEAARVLKDKGRCVFSFFLLDNYVSGNPRPLGFNNSIFEFEHSYEDWDDKFAIANPENVEEMTAYRLSLIEEFARKAGLKLSQEPVPGLWSGNALQPIGAQDIVILEKI